MTEHISTRKAIRNISDKKKFKEMLDKVILTEEERQIMELHYLKGMSLLQISYQLDYAEVTISRKHKKILNKIKNVIKED